VLKYWIIPANPGGTNTNNLSMRKKVITIAIPTIKAMTWFSVRLLEKIPTAV
tara:strand:+ start:490 stop:645 length:156 start_codon:yes stop_codon:yes gene_type:complete